MAEHLTHFAPELTSAPSLRGKLCQLVANLFAVRFALLCTHKVAQAFTYVNS